jgi:hypothetical protein
MKTMAVSARRKDQTTMILSRLRKNSPLPLLATPPFSPHPTHLQGSQSRQPLLSSRLVQHNPIRNNIFRFRHKRRLPDNPHAAAEPPDFLVDANASDLDTPIDSQLSTLVICARFPPGAFPLAQLHYQCIRPTTPNARRTPTATGVEKEKRKMCRRAGVVPVRRVGSESGERWMRGWELRMYCGDRHVGFRAWTICW